MAGGYVEKKENVVNLLKQQEGVASNQVMLRVRFAEVSRSALQELGASLHRSNGYKNDWYGRAQRPSSSPAPEVRRRQARPRDVQRLPEPVPLQLEARRRRGRQGAAEQRACSRAWPSRT